MSSIVDKFNLVNYNRHFLYRRSYSEPFIDVPGRCIKISDFMFNTFGSSIDEGEFSNRIVPSYPLSAWENSPEKISYGQGAIQPIAEKLKDEMHSDSNPIRDVLTSNLNIHRNRFGIFIPKGQPLKNMAAYCNDHYSFYLLATV